jgi:hypothetical protein
MTQRGQPGQGVQDSQLRGGDLVQHRLGCLLRVWPDKVEL